MSTNLRGYQTRTRLLTRLPNNPMHSTMKLLKVELVEDPYRSQLWLDLIMNLMRATHQWKGLRCRRSLALGCLSKTLKTRDPKVRLVSYTNTIDHSVGEHDQEDSEITVNSFFFWISRVLAKLCAQIARCER